MIRETKQIPGAMRNDEAIDLFTFLFSERSEIKDSIGVPRTSLDIILSKYKSRDAENLSENTEVMQDITFLKSVCRANQKLVQLEIPASQIPVGTAPYLIRPHVSFEMVPQYLAADLFPGELACECGRAFERCRRCRFRTFRSCCMRNKLPVLPKDIQVLLFKTIEIPRPPLPPPPKDTAYTIKDCGKCRVPANEDPTYATCGFSHVKKECPGTVLYCCRRAAKVGKAGLWSCTMHVGRPTPDIPHRK